jgi:hypothetical protein
MDGFDFRFAAVVKGGGNPEHVVRGQRPPAEKVRWRVNAIRKGQRTRDIQRLLEVLCADKHIVPDRYLVDTKPKLIERCHQLPSGVRQLNR